MKTSKNLVKWLPIGIGLILLFVVIYHMGRLVGGWIYSLP